MTRLLRHTVPLDGQIHTIAIPEFSRIVAVAMNFDSVRAVVFWTESEIREKPGPDVVRAFVVIPDVPDITQEIPDNFRPVGTAVDYGLRLVWHLCEETE